MRLVDTEVMNHTLILYHIFIYLYMFLVLADWTNWCKSFIQPSRYLGPSMRMFLHQADADLGAPLKRSPGHRVGWVEAQVGWCIRRSMENNGRGWHSGCFFLDFWIVFVVDIFILFFVAQRFRQHPSRNHETEPVWAKMAGMTFLFVQMSMLIPRPFVL